MGPRGPGLDSWWGQGAEALAGRGRGQRRGEWGGGGVRAEARPGRKSRMPLLLSFGAPICFPRGFGGCEPLPIAAAAAEFWVHRPSFLHPASSSPLPPVLWDPSPLAPMSAPNLPRSAEKEKHHFSGTLSFFRVLKTIAHLLSNTNIMHFNMFIKKGTCQGNCSP